MGAQHEAPLRLPVAQGRITEIWANSAGGSFGSGYLLGGGLILTARHVVMPEGATPPTVIKARPLSHDVAGLQPADLIWPDLAQLADPYAPDAVLLRLRDLPTGNGALPCLGPPDDDRGTLVSAIGFPAFAEKAGERRDTEEISGVVFGGTRLVAGRYEIKDITFRHREPLNQELDWRGMSGAALFSGHRVIGLLIARKQANERYDFSAIRIEKLLAIREFEAAIRGHVVLNQAAATSLFEPISDVTPIEVLGCWKVWLWIIGVILALYLIYDQFFSSLSNPQNLLVTYCSAADRFDLPKTGMDSLRKIAEECAPLNAGLVQRARTAIQDAEESAAYQKALDCLEASTSTAACSVTDLDVCLHIYRSSSPNPGHLSELSAKLALERKSSRCKSSTLAPPSYCDSQGSLDLADSKGEDGLRDFIKRCRSEGSLMVGRAEQLLTIKGSTQRNTPLSGATAESKKTKGLNAPTVYIKVSGIVNLALPMENLLKLDLQNIGYSVVNVYDESTFLLLVTMRDEPELSRLKADHTGQLTWEARSPATLKISARSKYKVVAPREIIGTAISSDPADKHLRENARFDCKEKILDQAKTFIPK